MAPRLLIYTGKGGVGKSVISAATAVKLSDMRYNVALLSTDPAHTIAHYFGIKEIKEEIKVSERLVLFHVDPMSELMKKFRAMSEYAIDWFKKYGIDEALAYELAMLPMVTEAVGLLKILDLIEKFDIVIVDTIPSAEALRLLYLPMIVTSVHKKLIKLSLTTARTASRVLSLILGSASKVGKAMEEEYLFFEESSKLTQLLTNIDITSVRVIANPDLSSIDEAVKTVGLAQVFNLNVDLGIVNKVIPNPQDEDTRRLQEEYINRFITSIYPIPVKKIPQLGLEVRGLDKLRKMAETLYGDEDPSKVYYKGKIMEIKEIGDKYMLIMRLPPGITDCLDIVHHGDELLIQLKSERGLVEKILPLPTLLRTARPESAYLEKGTLVIEFRKTT